MIETSAMRLVMRQSGEAAPGEVSLPLERLRDRLEERLLGALDSWEAEKKHLEEVVARAEAKMQEFREIADDVKRRLDALDLVTGMLRESEAEMPAEPSLPVPDALAMLSAAAEERAIAPVRSAAEESPRVESPRMDSPFGSSSRPLFTAEQRARAGKLSILQ